MRVRLKPCLPIVAPLLVATAYLQWGKWIQAIEFVDDIQSVGTGEGGFAEDYENFGGLANT